MNKYILTAAILCFLLGLVHSFLGEYLIFKHKRNKGALVPAKKSEGLREKHLRIIWATWHLATLFGWCIGLILLKIAVTESALDSDLVKMIIQPICATMFAGSLLVLIGTKGKHPGWIVLLIIGILLIF